MLAPCLPAWVPIPPAGKVNWDRGFSSVLHFDLDAFYDSCVMYIVFCSYREVQFCMSCELVNVP